MPSAPKSSDRAASPAHPPAERPTPRAARPALPALPAGPTVMGNRAFLRAWAARRAKLASPHRPT